MRLVTLFLSASFFLQAHAQEGYPGLTPDCWEQPRAVHMLEEVISISDYLSVSKLEKISGEKLSNTSPNHGYSFDYSNERSNSSITVDSEKSYLTEIALSNVFGLSDINWINENLIFFRVWLGREVFIDAIFHVEQERTIWSQSARRSNNAMSQFEGGCKQDGGCACIKKE